MKRILALFVAFVLIANTMQQLPTLPCLGLNERFVPCKDSCIHDTCDHVATPISCVSLLPCIGGCVCQLGFLRKNESAPCMPIVNCFL
ncbi:unnamed protein product, partial [Iphiclides podalirius]